MRYVYPGRGLAATGRVLAATSASTERGRLIGLPYVPLPLVVWRHSYAGITLGGTLKAFGTAPPAVTISGASTDLAVLYIACDGAGDETTGTFKWSIDGGTTFEETVVPIASSPYALGTTGITATFPAGTYATDQYWHATVSNWADQSGLARHAAQATASLQPIYGVGSNGRPVLRCIDADAAATVYMDGPNITQALPVTVVCTFTCTPSVPGEDCIHNFGGNRCLLVVDSTPQTRCYSGVFMDVAAEALNSSAFGNTLTVYNSAASSVYNNATLKATGNTGTAAPSQAGGIFSNGGTGRSPVADICEIIAYAGIVTEPYITQLYRRSQVLWGHA